MIVSKQTLTDYVSITEGQLHQGDCVFEQVSTDTRSLVPGDLFIALRGEHYDAHHYLDVAVNNGACGLVTEQYRPELAVPQLVVNDSVRAFGQMAAKRRQQFQGTVIGITGSSGKTTVKGMLNSILSNSGSTHATRGNFNNHIGVPITLMDLNLNARYAVVEEGTNHPGEIAYLTDIVRPNIALVTNIMPAHIEYFGDLGAIAEEKQSIYSTLTKDDRAIINLDDEFAQKFLQVCVNTSVLTFARSKQNKPADVYSELITVDSFGRPSVRLFVAEDYREITFQVIGEHNIDNALAAAACAFAAGVDLDAIKKGLENYAGDPGRMQSKEGLHQSMVIDDTYNANPCSVEAAIDFLASHKGPTLLALGNMAELGDHAEAFHREVGDYAKSAGIQALYTVGDLAQVSAQAFGEGARAFEQKDQLINAIQSSLQKNSMVLVKGSRSAAMEDVVNGIIAFRENNPLPQSTHHNNKEAS